MVYDLLLTKFSTQLWKTENVGTPHKREFVDGMFTFSIVLFRILIYADNNSTNFYPSSSK